VGSCCCISLSLPLSRSGRGIGRIQITELESAPLSKIERALKRTVDLFGAVGGLVLLSPLVLSIALLIKFGSKGPAQVIRSDAEGLILTSGYPYPNDLMLAFFIMK
jgi:hypothetical protein